MVQERSRAAAAARALAWALALAAAWLLLALVAPADRAAAEPLARDLGSLVDDALDPVEVVVPVELVIEAVAVPVQAASVQAAPVTPAPVAPAPAPAPVAPAPVIETTEPAASEAVVALVGVATAEPTSEAPALLPVGSLEHLADAAAALLGPVGQPVASILAPVVDLASPIVDPALDVVDHATGSVLEGVLPPLVDAIDGVEVLTPSVPDLPPALPAIAQGSSAPPIVAAGSLAASASDRSARPPSAAPLGGQPFSAGFAAAPALASVDSSSGAPSLGGGVVPPASAVASAPAAGTAVLGIVGFLLPLALLRGSARLGIDAEVPVGPAREHAPSPD